MRKADSGGKMRIADGEFNWMGIPKFMDPFLSADQRTGPGQARNHPGYCPQPRKTLWDGAQFWLNLQLSCDLYHAAHSPAAKKIRKIKRLPVLATAGIP